MKWPSLPLICFSVALPTSVFAQAQTIERQFNGNLNTDINVGIFTSMRANGTAGLLPVIGLVVPPAHGKITVKQGRVRATNFKQCLGVELSAFGYGPLGQARTNGAQEERSSPVIVVANPGICKLWNPRKKNRNGMFCNETLIVGTGPPGRPT